VKNTTWLLSVVISIFLAFGSAGCKKNGASGQPKTVEEGLMQLRAALATASPEVQSNLYNGVSNGIRYGNSLEALGALDQIASDPTLNGDQKKLVNNVAELLKQSIQNQQNTAQPAK
jgi:hypothetical protein